MARYFFKQVAWVPSPLLLLLLVTLIFASASFGLSVDEKAHRSSLPEPSRFLEWAQRQFAQSGAGGRAQKEGKQQQQQQQQQEEDKSSGSAQALGCKVAVLLHVPKTGGTTFSQEIFGSWQERLGFHVFRYRLSPGASMTHPEPGLEPAAAISLGKSRSSQFGLHADLSWEKLAERLVQIGLDTLTDVSLLRVAVELHFCLGLRASVGALRSIRAALEPRGCTVVVGTLVREPFDHQLSWLGMRGLLPKNPSQHLREDWLTDLQEFVVPNMQARWLWFEGMNANASGLPSGSGSGRRQVQHLSGLSAFTSTKAADAGLRKLNQATSSKTHGLPPGRLGSSRLLALQRTPPLRRGCGPINLQEKYPQLSKSDTASLQYMLDGEVDVVGTTFFFNETVLAFACKLGIPATEAMQLEKSDNVNHQRAGHIVNHDTLARFESLEQAIPEYNEVEAQCTDDRLLWHRYTKRMVGFIRGVLHLVESRVSSSQNTGIEEEDRNGHHVSLKSWVLGEIHNGILASQSELSKL